MVISISRIFSTTSVIVFIDEIDAIACEQGGEPLRIDFKAALQQLWLEMDRYKNDPRIFIIVATNNFKRMDKTFLDRFGNNIIEVKNPDAATRSVILEYYFGLYNITFTKEFFDSLVAQTKGLSIRSLEDLANDVSIAASIDNYGIATQEIVLTTLANIKKKFNTTNDSQWQAKLERTNLYICIASGILLGLVNSFSLYDRAMEYIYPENA